MDLPVFFKAALEASWQGSLVILLILLLRPLFGWRVPARWRSLLWTLVLLRLLVPAFLLPRSPASLQNIPLVDRPFEHAAQALDFPARSPESASATLRNQGPDEGQTAAPAIDLETPSRRPWWQIAAAVWIAGTALTGLWILVGTLLLRRRLRRDSTEAPAPVSAVWDLCCARVFPKSRTRFRPRLVQSGAVSSPALVGLLRPLLLIPRQGCENLSAEDWEHIFMHELAHFRRHDHWTHALQLVALCLHWFNPLVWLGFRYLRADRELAADDWALRHLENARPVAYGQTLLKVLTAHSRHGLNPGLVGILEDSAQMKQRLRHIGAFVPRRLAGSILGIGVALALALVVIGRQTETVDLKDYSDLAPAEILVTAARNGEIAVVRKTLEDGTDINAIANLHGERTALSAAIVARQMEIVRLLIERGVDVNFKAGKADPPIIIALWKGWPECRDLLLAKGATCAPELLAAAKGDSPAVQKYLTENAPAYSQVKLLAEIAAAHGHRELFATLYDALKQQPEQHDYFPFSRSTFVNAVANGHRGIIEELLARDPNLKPSDSVNRLAAAAQRTPGMREWLISQGVQVPEYNDGERLIDAAEREDLPGIRRLLAAGVDINYRGESAWMPLCKAAVWGCPRAVKLLLEHHADPNPPRYSYSTLELASSPEIADLLVAAGAKVKPEDIDYSVSQGSLKMVQWFLDHGIDPQRQKDRGAQLLIDAATPELVQLLVAHGATFRGFSKEELTGCLGLTWTPEALELLIAAGADVNQMDKSGFAPLVRLLMHNWTNPARRVEVLLRHGANPNTPCQDGSGRFPLMFAHDAATIDALVNAGADLYAVDDHGLTVVARVRDSTRPRVLQALAKYGIRDDAFMQTYGSAGKNVSKLMFAASRGNLEQLQALTTTGAALDEQTANGYTALHFAVRCGQVAAARWLLERGANVNAFDEFGLTPALLASPVGSQYIRRGGEPISEETKKQLAALFAAHKIDPNYHNEAGETAIMRAAACASHNYGFEVVLATHPDLNLQRRDGMTALMLAVICPPPNDGSTTTVTTAREPDKEPIKYSLQAYLVKLLIDHGADLNLRNQAGKSALDLARENGNAEILTLLEKTAR